MLKLSKRQWSNYMSQNSQWMANMVLDEYGRPPKYIKLQPLAVSIFMRSLSRVQQERSYFENLVVKEDIFDTKHQLKENVILFINEENDRTEYLD